MSDTIFELRVLKNLMAAIIFPSDFSSEIVFFDSIVGNQNDQADQRRPSAQGSSVVGARIDAPVLAPIVWIPRLL